MSGVPEIQAEVHFVHMLHVYFLTRTITVFVHGLKHAERVDAHNQTLKYMHVVRQTKQAHKECVRTQCESSTTRWHKTHKFHQQLKNTTNSIAILT